MAGSPEQSPIRLAQAEERKRLARALHDGPIQSLANIFWEVGLCENLAGTDPGRAKAELGKLKQLVRNTMLELRQAAADLRRTEEESADFMARLRGYLAALPEAPPVCLVVSGAERSLSPAVAHHCLAIVQEGLANSRRHAAAARVLLRIKWTARKIILLLWDDGIGFDYTGAMARDAAEGHFGLLGIGERVEEMAGKYRIHSAPGKGTRLLVVAPLRGQAG